MLNEYRTRLIADVVTGKLDVPPLPAADSLAVGEELDHLGADGEEGLDDLDAIPGEAEA